MEGTRISYISSAKPVLMASAVYPFGLTASSEPNVDGWGFDEYWTGQTYVDWYKLNEMAFGSEVAKNKMLRAIEQWSFGGAEYDFCYDRAFNDFFTSKGVDITTIFCTAVNTVFDLVEDAGSVASNTSGMIAKVTSFVKTAAPFVLVGAGVWALDKYVLPAAKNLKKETVSGRKKKTK